MNTEIGNKAYSTGTCADWIGFIDSYQGKKRNKTIQKAQTNTNTNTEDRNDDLSSRSESESISSFDLCIIRLLCVMTDDVLFCFIVYHSVFHSTHRLFCFVLFYITNAIQCIALQANHSIPFSHNQNVSSLPFSQYHD